MKVAVGSLAIGASFKTVLTGRSGYVMDKIRSGNSGGIRSTVEVALENPQERKQLHVDVIVAVEQ